MVERSYRNRLRGLQVRFLPVVISFLLLVACNGGSPSPQPRPTPVATATPVSVPPQSPTPSSTPFTLPCADPSNNITKQLEDAIARGVEHTGGGCIRSKLIVDGTLKLGPGVYQVIDPILYKNAIIEGAGWNTIIAESSKPRQWYVISGLNQTIENGRPEGSIVIRNLRIVGANPGFNSTGQAISLGNCNPCEVDNVWIDGTKAIGLQVGGGGMKGHYTSNFKITNCLFTRVASQVIAVVNAQDGVIRGNRILNPGQVGGPGTASIDLEMNVGQDRLINIDVEDNFIDHRGSEMETTGNGIMVNAADSQNISGIRIRRNQLIGGHPGPEVVTNKMPNGIFLSDNVGGRFIKGVIVTENKIIRTGQTGIWILGSGHTVEGNTLVSVGGGGTEGFRIQASNSIIRFNRYSCIADPCSSEMTVQGTGNTISENPGWTVRQ